MKKLNLMFVLLFVATILSAQSVEQQTISSMGTYSENGPSLSTTVGQPANKTLETSDVILTQGFQQTKVIISSVETPLPKEEIEATIYPNPSTDKISVKCSDELLNEHPTLVLRDMTGRLVVDRKMTSTVEIIDLQSLSEGYYLLSVITKTARNTYKIQKLKIN
jgi:hypothetical protein